MIASLHIHSNSLSIILLPSDASYSQIPKAYYTKKPNKQATKQTRPKKKKKKNE